MLKEYVVRYGKGSITHTKEESNHYNELEFTFSASRNSDSELKRILLPLVATAIFDLYSITHSGRDGKDYLGTGSIGLLNFI